MANRYQTPIPGQFINTYAPLPTQELLAIGGAMAARADQARNDLAAYNEKHANFRSLSNIDTENYYNLTTRRMADLAAQVVQNPDFFKQAAGRAQIAQTINDTDYASLAMLTQSRDTLNQRFDAERKLAAEGEYRHNWHFTDYGNYDTLGSNQVFQAVAPDPYVTIAKDTDHYFTNIKPSVLRVDGDWMYTGIDAQRVRDTANQAAIAYSQTQRGQRHIQDAVDAGVITADQGVEFLADEMFQANHFRIMSEQAANPVAALQRKIAASKGSDSSLPLSRTAEYVSGLMQRDRQMSNTYEITPTPAFQKRFIDSATSIGINRDLATQMANISTPIGMNDVLQNLITNGIVDQEQAQSVMNEYMADRAPLIERAVMNPEYRRGLSQIVEPAHVRQYLGAGLDTPEGRENSFVYTDSSGTNLGTYTRLPKAATSGMVFANNAGEIATDFTDESLVARNQGGGIRQLIANDPYTPASVVADIFGVSLPASESLKKAMPKILDPERGLMRTLVEELSNDMQFAPEGSITAINASRQGNASRNVVASGSVMVSRSAFEASASKWLKDNRVDHVSTSDLIRLMSGEYADGQTRAILTPVTARKRNVDTKEADAINTKAQDVLKINVYVPVFNDLGATMGAEMQYQNNIYGGSNAAKSNNFNVEYGVGLIDNANWGITPNNPN